MLRVGEYFEILLCLCEVAYDMSLCVCPYTWLCVYYNKKLLQDIFVHVYVLV